MALNQSAAWAALAVATQGSIDGTGSAGRRNRGKFTVVGSIGTGDGNRVTGLKVGITGIRQHRWFWPDTSKQAHEAIAQTLAWALAARPTSAWVRQLPRRRSHECSAVDSIRSSRFRPGTNQSYQSPLLDGQMSPACCGGIMFANIRLIGIKVGMNSHVCGSRG